jgi:transposase-like protein
MLVNDKNGISSWELHRALGVTQKTAWFMLHRIRAALKAGSFRTHYKMGERGGPTEVDETFIGAKRNFMHAGKKQKYEGMGWMANKTVVMGFLDRELRQVRARVIPDIKRETLQNEVLDEVQRGSKLYTDQAGGYEGLQGFYVHDVVNKMQSYVDGQVHVNGLENFWSCLKRSLKGTYIAVEPFHLERYIDEQIFRYNNRATKDNPLNDSDRFVCALSQIVGKRLTYKEVTGKEGEAQSF